MEKFLTACICVIWSVAAPASADQWISLGGNFGLGSELNISSIRMVDDITYLSMRTRSQADRGVITMHLDMAVYCGKGIYYIQSGQISSDWSSHVAPMPDLPDEERFVQLPTKNPSFNNMYDYVCR